MGLNVKPVKGVGTPLGGLGVGPADGAAVGTFDLEDHPVPPAMGAIGR